MSIRRFVHTTCTLAIFVNLLIVTASAAPKVEYWIWDLTQMPATQKAVELFEAKHDIEVEVQLVPFPEYFTKVTLSLISGTGPDVFWMTMYDFGAFHKNGMLLNLQPFIDQDAEAADHIDTMWPVLTDFYAPEGQTYGFPRDFDTIAMVYNEDAVREAGLADIDEIDDLWTWDDMVDYAKRLTVRRSEGVTRWGYATTGWGQIYWYPLLSANGASVFNADGTKAILDAPNAIQAIQFLADLRHVHGVAPHDALEDFPSGQVAMLNQGSWHLKELAENTPFSFNVAALPRSPYTMKQGSTVHGLANVISPVSKQQEAAFAFVKFLASEEANLILGETGTVIPARRDAAKTWFDSNDYPSNRVAFQNAVNYAAPHPATPYLSTAEWQGVANNFVNQALAGAIPVDQALTLAAQQINASLAEAIAEK